MKKNDTINYLDNLIIGESGKIFSINISKGKGGKKYPVKDIYITEFGLEGDGHCGDWHRQVSLLSYESIQDVIKKGVNVSPGDFAENITTAGIKIANLKIGDLIIISSEPVDENDLLKNNLPENKRNVVLKITQIGKECINPCRIYHQLGSCIMPTEGIFCKVIKTGKIKVGDNIYGKNI